MVDTRRLPNGMNTFYAKVDVYRSGTASSLLPFKSGNVILTVQQPPESTLGVHLSSPTYGSRLTGITPVCAEINNPSAAALTRVVFTMQNEQSGAVYTLGTDTAAPYACNLNPQSYQQFPQTTAYLLFATAYFNLGGGSILDVRSEPVLVTIPAVMPPTNLTAVATNGSIQLHWQDNSSNEQKFCVYRKIGSGGTYAIVARPPTNSIAYLDSASIIPGTQYYYKISAFKSNVDVCLPIEAAEMSLSLKKTTAVAAEISLSSKKTTAVAAKASLPPNNTITVEEFSNEAVVTALLNSPSALLISQASGDGVQLGWALPTDRRGIANIVIDRKLDLPGEGFTEIGKVGGGATSFLDQSIAKSSYCYRVRAVNALISSAASNEVSVTLDFPNAPLNLAATRAGTIINLNWTDLSKDETGFVILRSVGTNTNFTLRASLPVNTISFQDSGTSPSISYYYRVRADKNGQWSASKAEAAVLGALEYPPDERLIDKRKSSTLQY